VPKFINGHFSDVESLLAKRPSPTVHAACRDNIFFLLTYSFEVNKAIPESSVELSDVQAQLGLKAAA